MANSLKDNKQTASLAQGDSIPYRLLFEESPNPYLILKPNAPQFTIMAVNNSYLKATNTQRSDLLGKGVFEVFPDNPEDSTTTGVKDLKTSLLYVIENKTEDVMGIQKYDIPSRSPSESGFEVRYWSPVNTPVVDEGGKIQYIIHHVEDITDFMLLQESSTQGNKELQNMQDKLNQMQAEVIRNAQEVKATNRQLKAANIALKQSEERAHILVESVKDYAIFMLDPHGYVMTWNEGAQIINGYKADEIIRRHFSKFYTPADIERGYPDYELKVAAEAGRYEDEGFRIRKNGEIYWANVVITALHDDNGELIGFTKVTRDLTLRKRLEDELVEKTQKLEVANKELESFSYSVSHDLRAPLRSIDGFSQAVLEDYSDKLDERGKKYLQLLRENSQQMAELIDDLLKLSRLSRDEMYFEEVNLSKIALDIAEELHNQEPSRRVKFSICEGLIVQGDKRLLQAVLQNLFENSWKFTSKHPTAHIEFGILKENGKLVYFVRDDGAGFDMEYVGKLFNPFQRLHGVKEFPGTGIGLATIARIIHRHSGEVWAEGEVEKGATIYFTLKSNDNEEESV